MDQKRTLPKKSFASHVVQENLSLMGVAVTSFHNIHTPLFVRTIYDFAYMTYSDLPRGAVNMILAEFKLFLLNFFSFMVVYIEQ